MPKSLELTRRVSLLLAAGVLALVALLPAFGIGQVGAEQLTSRSATIDKSYPEATDVEYVFEFDIPTGGGTAVQSIRLQWCTQPLGTCVAPTDSGTAFDASGFTVDAQSFTETGTFASNGGIDENDCTAATNSTYEVCLTRTQTTPEDVGTKSITLSGINHPDDEQTIYVRINLYSGEDFATADHQHYGVVAAAIVQQITVTARVQERLVFCVGTETSAGSAAATDDCAEVSGTTQDLGAVDFLAVCVTLSNPCETNNPSDTTGSFALVATNAQEGAGVTYYAEQDTTGGASDHLGSLRIPGADCENEPTESSVDQCFNSAGWDDGIPGFNAPVNIVAGTESFGMTVSDINQGGLTSNMVRDADYRGDGSTGNATACTGAADEPCWAWDPTGDVVPIASSNDVLDNEVLLIQFAATASLTTPTGQYAVTSTYVATPTF